MPKSWYSIAFLTSILLTTILLYLWQESMYPIEVLLLLVGSILVFIIISFAVRSSLAAFFVVILIGVLLSFIRVQQTTEVITENHIASYAVENPFSADLSIPEMIVKGVIVHEPDKRPLKTKYVVQANVILSEVPTMFFDFGSHSQSFAQDDVVGTGACTEPDEASKSIANSGTSFVYGKILVSADPYPPLHYGDEVLVTGILQKPGIIEQFHYDRYLSRYDIYTVMYRADIERLSSGHGLTFLQYLFRLKEHFEAKLNRLYPEPHASFMAGLLTGSRRGIPEHLLSTFQRTGLTHIIAISGYNVSIIIGVLSGLLFFIPLYYRLWPSIIAIILFTFFVGASPPVVRAAIMGALMLTALHVGRERDPTIAILLAGALMTLWNPKVLWYDAGFQLSFLAVIGLMVFLPYLLKWCVFFPDILGMREAFSMTISAQLFAVPYMIYLFGSFSLIAPVVNILVAPLIPLAMLFGFLGTVVGFFSEYLGRIIAFLGWGALEGIICIAEYFEKVPYGYVDTGTVRAWFLVGYYVVLVIVILVFRKRMACHP